MNHGINLHMTPSLTTQINHNSINNITNFRLPGLKTDIIVDSNATNSMLEISSSVVRKKDVANNKAQKDEQKSVAIKANEKKRRREEILFEKRMA